MYEFLCQTNSILCRAPRGSGLPYHKVCCAEITLRFCRPDPLVARLQQQTLGAKPKYHKDQKSISRAKRYWYFSLWCLGKAPPFQFLLNFAWDFPFPFAYSISNSPRAGCKNEMDAFRAESDLGKLFFLIKILLFALSDLPWKHFTIFHFTFTSSIYLELNYLQPAFGVGRRFLSPKLYQCKIFLYICWSSFRARKW